LSIALWSADILSFFYDEVFVVLDGSVSDIRACEAVGLNVPTKAYGCIGREFRVIVRFR
jgi:hypothetical protein